MLSAHYIDFLAALGVLIVILIVVLVRKVWRRLDAAPIRRSSRSSSRKSSRSSAAESLPAAPAEAAVENPPPAAPHVPAPAPLPTQVASIPAASGAVEPEIPDSLAEDQDSQLWVKIVEEESATNPGHIEFFVILAKARIHRRERPKRFMREVSLSARGSDEVDQPLHTPNPEWYRPDGRNEFYYLSDSAQPEEEDLHSTKWISVLRVPVNQLEFAVQGQNEFRALVTWRDRFSKLVVARGRGELACNVLTPGYSEKPEEPPPQPTRRRH